MRKSDIFHNRPRPGPEYGDKMRAAVRAHAVELQKAAVLRSSWTSRLKDLVASGVPKDEALGQVGDKPEEAFQQRDAFTVPFGQDYFGYPTGTRYRLQDDPPRGLCDTLEPHVAPAGSLPVNAYINGFPVPAGVVVVSGQGNKTKTPAAIVMADIICRDDEKGFGMLRYGETFCRYNKSFTRAAVELGELMANHRAVVFDSVKDLMTSLGGSAAEQGIARAVLTYLSELSMTAAELGCTVLVPVNPTSSKDSVVEFITEIARSNTAMVIAASDDKSWPILARTGEGKMRANGTIEVWFDKDGQPDCSVTYIEPSKPQQGEKGPVLSHSSKAHGDEAFFISAILKTTKTGQ